MPQKTGQILEQILTRRQNERIMILAPIVRGRKGEYRKDLEKLGRQGFVRARIDGELRGLDEEITLDKRRNHTIEVVVDRLLIKPGVEQRLRPRSNGDKLADGLVTVCVVAARAARRKGAAFSQKLACRNAEKHSKLEPRSFSFKQPVWRVRGAAGSAAAGRSIRTR
jgi:excinuclease ABC subunit A